MKKVLASLLAVVMLLALLPMGALSVSAASKSGKTGDCKWVLNGTKLTISGNGKMGDYNVAEEELAPWGTAVTSVTIKEGVTSVGVGAFYVCMELNKVTLPSTLIEIRDLAFCGCVSLTKITLPENLKVIGGGAFSLCGIEHVTVPWSVSKIGDMAFYVSALEEIFLPNVGDLGAMAFAGCVNLKEAVLCDSISGIMKGTFMGCESLASVTFDEYMEDIGESAFSGCTNLKDVYYTGDKWNRENHLYIRKDNDPLTEGAEWHYECGPIILRQPESVRVPYGETARVYACAMGKTVSYEWWYKDEGDTEYQKSPQNSAVYTVKMTGQSKNRRVICYVREINGNRIKCGTVMIKPAIDLVTKPEQGYAPMGEKVKVKAKFSGIGLRYEWWIKNEGSNKYVKSSITSSTYTATMTEKSKNRRVLCKAYDKYGNMLKTESVQLRESVSIKTQPKSATVAKGKSARVTVKASGDGLRYEWYFKNVGSAKYSKSSITSATYSVKMSSVTNGRKLLCYVYDKYGNRVQTKTVVVKMK